MNDDNPSDQTSEYEVDFRKWAREQARLLREGRLDAIDAASIASELEDLTGNEEAAVRSSLGALMHGLLTWQFRPGMASPALRDKIETSRQTLLEHMESPSLREVAADHLENTFGGTMSVVLGDEGRPFVDAPYSCPYMLDQMIEPGFLPRPAPSPLIRFAERETVFAGRDALAHHIHRWQLATLDPGPMRARPGDRVFIRTTDDRPTLLDENTAAAFNAQTTADLDALRDRFDRPPPRLDFAGTIIASINTTDMPAFANVVGERFCALCRAMDWREIAVLPAVRRPILSEFTRKGYGDRRLREAGLDDEFTDAIVGPPDGFLRILGALFWIVRLKISAPQIVFSAAGSSVVGTLCQYANIHFECYDARERERLAAALPGSGFTIAEGGVCEAPFSKTGEIPGRYLDVR